MMVSFWQHFVSTFTGRGSKWVVEIVGPIAAERVDGSLLNSRIITHSARSVVSNFFGFFRNYFGVQPNFRG